MNSKMAVTADASVCLLEWTQKGGGGITNLEPFKVTKWWPKISASWFCWLCQKAWHSLLCYSNISKIDFKCNCSLLVLISFHEPCHSFCMQTIVMSFQIDLKRLFNFSFHYYKQITLTRLRKNRKKSKKNGICPFKIFSKHLFNNIKQFMFCTLRRYRNSVLE